LKNPWGEGIRIEIKAGKEAFMFHWKKAMTLGMAGFLFSLASCSKAAHDVEERYFLVCANTKVPYWQTVAAGLNQAAAQLKVRTDLVGPENYDAKAQQQEFQRILTLKPTGILVSPADAELLKNDIDNALSRGIPVITLDSDSPSSKRLFYIGTNNYQAGIMGGKRLVESLKGKGNVVAFTMPDQSNLKERLAGYQAVLAEHPQIKIAEIVDIKGDPGIAFDKTIEIAEKRPDKVDAFICLEANAGADVALALGRKGVKNKTIVAMDADPETLQAIKEGTIAATIAQKPFTMAYFGLMMLDNFYHHKLPSLTRDWAKDPFSVIPAIMDTGATMVDRSNVDDFIQAQQSQAGAPKL
jgi:ribose transport system substrate-binding protein